MSKKTLAVILGIILGTALFTGCGKNKPVSNYENNNPVSESASHEEKESDEKTESLPESGVTEEMSSVAEQSADRSAVFPYAETRDLYPYAAGNISSSFDVNQTIYLNGNKMNYLIAKYDLALNGETAVFLETSEDRLRGRMRVISKDFEGAIEDWVEIDMNNQAAVEEYWGIRPIVADCGDAALCSMDGSLMWINCTNGEVKRVCEKEKLLNYADCYRYTCISPDGQTVAFVADNNGVYSLRVWKSDGTTTKIADGKVPFAVANNAEFIYCCSQEDNYSTADRVISIFNEEGFVTNYRVVYYPGYSWPITNADATELFATDPYGDTVIWAEGELKKIGFGLNNIEIENYSYYGSVKPSSNNPITARYAVFGYLGACRGENSFKDKYYLDFDREEGTGWLYYVDASWDATLIDNEVSYATTNINGDVLCYVKNGELIYKTGEENRLLADNVKLCSVTRDGKTVYYADEQGSLWLWNDGEAEEIDAGVTNMSITAKDVLAYYKGRELWGINMSRSPMRIAENTERENLVPPTYIVDSAKDTGKTIEDYQLMEGRLLFVDEDMNTTVLNEHHTFRGEYVAPVAQSETTESSVSETSEETED